MEPLLLLCLIIPGALLLLDLVTSPRPRPVDEEKPR
jgi:hypothetical protein